MSEAVKFHLSLNVPDLGRAVGFYSTLFGLAPAKRHADYAKFEVEDPPVVFSLVPHPPGGGCSLSHLGLRVADEEAIAAYRQRLEAAGINCEAQDATVCGYSKQNKLWVKDPFGNFWDVHCVECDIDPATVRQSLEGTAARADIEAAPSGPAGPVVWEHFVSNPVPDRVPHADGEVDEVRLVGTLNAELGEAEISAVFAEAARVLRPGGKVLLHGLMSDAPFGGTPNLPGMAAMVSRVPSRAEAIAALRSHGFVGVQAVKFDAKPWLRVGGNGLREIKLIAWKPDAPAASDQRQVLYKGPFGEAVADGGRRFRRGERVAVPAALWQQLRHGPGAEQFLFFEPGDAACAAS